MSAAAASCQSSDHRHPHHRDDSAKGGRPLEAQCRALVARSASGQNPRLHRLHGDRALRHGAGLQRQRRDERVDLRFVPPERGQLLALEIAPRRQLHAERIDLVVAHQHLVVQMRSGRHAGRADEGDHLTLAHAHAAFEAARVTRKVSVRGLVGRAVPDADIFSVPAVPADELDDAVARRHHRRSGGRAEIDAAMHARVAEHRMTAPAEGRRDARAVDRRFHQHALTAPPFGREVVGRPVVASGEAVELFALARERERGIGDVAAFDLRPVAVVVAGIDELELCRPSAPRAGSRRRRRRS